MIKLKCKGIIGAVCLMSMMSLAHALTLRYQNQRGSILQLSWSVSKAHTGQLTGTFTTAVGNCKQDMQTPIPVVGFYNGNALSLAINFPHCRQVLVMAGHWLANKHKISMMWLDTRVAKHPLGKDWDSHLMGADFYKKIA